MWLSAQAVAEDADAAEAARKHVEMEEESARKAQQRKPETTRMISAANIKVEIPSFDPALLRAMVTAAASDDKDTVVDVCAKIQQELTDSPQSKLAAMSRKALNRALSKACEEGHSRVVRELLRVGANPAHVNKQAGLTPLEAAVQAKSVETVRVLLHHGLRAAGDGDDSSAGSAEAKRQHLMHANRRRWRGWHGEQSLARACELDEEEIVAELLEAGIAVTRQAIVAAAPDPHLHPPAGDEQKPRGDVLPLLINAHCTSPEVEAKGLRIEHSLETLCRKDTWHNRNVYLQVRRLLLTHVLGMSTNELVEAQVRSLRAIPFEGLSDAIFLAKAFVGESDAADKANDRLSGDQLGQAAMRVQLVAVGCLHLLATHDPECMLAFLHSRRAQSLLQEAAESEALDGACKALLSSREVQHIFMQRWRGSNPLLPTGTLKQKIIGRLLLPWYCLAATIYPKLDLRDYMSTALHRYLIPSPRLKFAVHSIFDFTLAVLLVIAHALYGPLHRLADPSRWAGLDLNGAYFAYLVLSVWVGTIVYQELIQLVYTARRQYRKLSDETANPSVYAPLKHRIDAEGLAQMQMSYQLEKRRERNMRAAAKAAKMTQAAATASANGEGQGAQVPRKIKLGVAVVDEVIEEDEETHQVVVRVLKADPTPAPVISANLPAHVTAVQQGASMLTPPPSPPETDDAAAPMVGRGGSSGGGSEQLSAEGGPQLTGDPRTGTEQDAVSSSASSSSARTMERIRSEAVAKEPPPVVTVAKEGGGGGGGGDGERGSGSGKHEAGGGSSAELVPSGGPHAEGGKGSTGDASGSGGGGDGDGEGSGLDGAGKDERSPASLLHLKSAKGSSSRSAGVSGRPKQQFELVLEDIKGRGPRDGSLRGLASPSWDGEGGGEDDEEGGAARGRRFRPSTSRHTRESARHTKRAPGGEGGEDSGGSRGLRDLDVGGTSRELGAGGGGEGGDGELGRSTSRSDSEPQTPRGRRNSILGKQASGVLRKGDLTKSNQFGAIGGKGLAHWRRMAQVAVVPLRAGENALRGELPFWTLVLEWFRDREGEFVPLLTVCIVLGILAVVIITSVLGGTFITTIVAFFFLILLVHLLFPSFSVASRPSALLQVFLVASRIFISEPYRILNFCARSVTFASLVMRCTYAGWATNAYLAPVESYRAWNSVDEMYALGVLIALLRQTHLLHMIPGQSPFLILFARFVTTVFNLVAVLSAILFAFTGGFFVLYYHDVPREEACGWRESDPWERVLLIVFMNMLTTSINGEGDFSCADKRTEENEYLGAFAVAMLCIFLGFVLLLVNSLIAAMTKEFDNVWETQHILGCCSRVQRINSAESLRPMPPPVSILSGPYQVYRILKWLLRITCGRKRTMDDEDWEDAEETAVSADVVDAHHATHVEEDDDTDEDLKAFGEDETIRASALTSTRLGDDNSPMLPATSHRESEVDIGDVGDVEIGTIGDSPHSIGHDDIESVPDEVSIGAAMVDSGLQASDRGESGSSVGVGGRRSPTKMRQRSKERTKRGGRGGDKAGAAGAAGTHNWRLTEVAAIRALWKAWKERMSEEDCREHVLEYVHAREDEVLEDGLWRTRFARKVHEGREQTMEQLLVLREAQRELAERSLLIARAQEQHQRDMAHRMEQVERLVRQMAKVGGGAGAGGGGGYGGDGRTAQVTFEDTGYYDYDTRARDSRASSIGGWREVGGDNGGRMSSMHRGSSGFSGGRRRLSSAGYDPKYDPMLEERAQTRRGTRAKWAMNQPMGPRVSTSERMGSLMRLSPGKSRDVSSSSDEGDPHEWGGGEVSVRRRRMSRARLSLETDEDLRT